MAATKILNAWLEKNCRHIGGLSLMVIGVGKAGAARVGFCISNMLGEEGGGGGRW